VCPKSLNLQLANSNIRIHTRYTIIVVTLRIYDKVIYFELNVIITQ